MPNETTSLRAAGNSAPARRAPQAPRRRRRREDSCRRTGQPNHYRDHADREIYDSDERCCVASKARRCGDQEESAATCSVTRPAVAPLVAIHSPAITSAVAAHPWASSSIGEVVSLKPATISATSPNVRNSWTPEPRIARLEFDDGPDECLLRSFRSGLLGARRRREQPAVLATHQRPMKCQECCGAEGDGDLADASWTEENRPESEQ